MILPIDIPLNPHCEDDGPATSRPARSRPAAPPPAAVPAAIEIIVVGIAKPTPAQSPPPIPGPTQPDLRSVSAAVYLVAEGE